MARHIQQTVQHDHARRQPQSVILVRESIRVLRAVHHQRLGHAAQTDVQVLRLLHHILAESGQHQLQ